jgi:hypothetical protein
VVLTEDNRNRKPSRAPCPVGLNQHVLGLAPSCDVRNGRNDETQPKPRDAGRGRAPRGTRPKAKKFVSERRAQGNPAEPRLRMDPASEKSSPAVDRAVGGRRNPATGSDIEAEEDPMTPVRVRSATSPAMQPNDLATAAQAGIRHSPRSSHRSSSSLFLEPGIDL